MTIFHHLISFNSSFNLNRPQSNSSTNQNQTMDYLNEACCVCYEMNLSQVQKDGNLNCVRLVCCGNCYCRSCSDSWLKRAEDTGIEWTCPMCRAFKPKNAKEVFDMAMSKAMEGRGWAQEMVANYYYNGENVTQSYPKAFEFFSLAAAQGGANSLNLVGTMYENGEGVDQSYEQAFKFFSLAAEKGLAGGQCNLATCYYNGQGVEKDYEKAFELYSLAGGNCHPGGLGGLGVCYINGHGVEKDYEKAAHYYTLAAEGGNKYSQFFLGIFYKIGQGVIKSHVNAIYWFKQCRKDKKDKKLCEVASEEINELLSIAREVCASCQSKDKKAPLKCSRCLSAFYCNSECQAKHWKVGGHKQECKKP